MWRLESQEHLQKIPLTLEPTFILAINITVFSLSLYIYMYTEEFMLSNWCWRRLESPLDRKDIKLVNPKENRPWIFIWKTDAEAEAPTFWPPDAKSQLTGKDFAAGKDWGQEQKRATDNEMVGWHHPLNGHEFEQTLGDGEGQGNLVCWHLWGHKESDTTEWLNNN